MLDLPNVTLLFVETRAHGITERVIADCISKVNFGEILLYTDKPDLIRFDPNRRARTILVPDFPDKKEAGRFYYSEAMAKVETDFALMMEWDAGIYDPSKWRSEFFNYDYIGAPWITRYQGDLDVGNGGFTLMSKRLGHFLCENTTRFPVCTDVGICKDQRLALEEAGGFKWAEHELASRFSWELGPRNPANFGFHGAFNWPDMLERKEIVERAKIMLASPYLTGKMGDLVRRGRAGWLQQEVGDDLWANYLGYHPSPMISQQARLSGQMQRINMNRLLMERQTAYLNQQRSGLKA